MVEGVCTQGESLRARQASLHKIRISTDAVADKSQYQTNLNPLAEVINKIVLVSLPKRGVGEEANVEARAEAMVKGVWAVVDGLGG